jgi:hypothetical protein
MGERFWLPIGTGIHPVPHFPSVRVSFSLFLTLHYV